VLWFTGEDIPFVPNKRFGGVCLGGKIAPIFYNTMEDAGALPIELDVSKMDMGDVVELRPYDGKALKNGEVIAEFQLKSDVLFDEVRAGGRIPLIIGRGLTAKAREALGLPRPTCSACRSSRPTPARASRWRRRWSAAPAACRKARACARAPTANRR
jgi:aconitate hydratase 2/2-methylisocitrate dehydratase